MEYKMSNFDSPMPLSEIEDVLGWVDTFKLSRPTKKINRDFADAVLLAEILSVHYPKLVEMHNYPPRNSHAMKLNNWMTLNRKVLKKLKLNLCCNTMEQLANSAPGIIERVLVMVRDKIKRDEELNKSTKDAEQNVSSGGSYYEACGDVDNILVIPVKTRVNGVLEMIQRKVVDYESFIIQKEELRDLKESTEVLKQKVEHLETLLKLKDERIDELQTQLERKQARRKEVEAQNTLAVPFENTLAVPFENVPSPHQAQENVQAKPIPMLLPTKIPSLKSLEIKPLRADESRTIIKSDSLKIDLPKVDSLNLAQPNSDPSHVSITDIDNLDTIKSDIFKEVEVIDEPNNPEFEDFKDSVQDTMTTIHETIKNEMNDITNSFGLVQDLSC